MTLAVRNPEDVVNLALVRMGRKDRINSLVDGTRLSTIFLDIYAQTRDELLHLNDWGFAERDRSLVLLKQAPVDGYVPPVSWSSIYPPIPWTHQYEYPTDCIKVRSLKQAPLLMPDFDPQPFLFKIANDSTYTPTKKVILCYVQDAIMVYTAQVTDPLVWEPAFVEALAASLARRAAPALAPPSVAKAEMQDESLSTALAAMSQG